MQNARPSRAMGSSAKPQLPPRGMKKRGRPSLLDIQKRSRRLQAAAFSASRNPGGSGSANPYLRFPSNSSSSSSSLRRFICRSRSPVSASSADGDEEDAEGHGSGRRRRREKELNLVLKAEEDEGSHRKRRAAADADRDKVGSSASNKSAKATDSKQEEVSNSGPATPLPDQKLLVLILDRLQKKDTYGVFSEPVDPEELPDYHDIIDHPMDFGTVREKLSGGKYPSLEQFEKDVFLISSNAMSYNASDTVYFCQARAIHELAKKNFENLRQECDGNEAQPKPVVRRGRPPNKFKKAPGSVTEQNQLYRSDKSGNADDSTCPPNTETFSRLSKQKLNMNYDYSGSSSLKGFTKYGKNPPVIDESRRNTYKQPEWSTSAYEHPVHAIFAGPGKFIVPVGINMEHACARSIARFATNFGPVGLAAAARRLEWLLPLGTKVGPGWVGEGESLAKTPEFSASPGPFPELNSLPSTMTKSGHDKLVQIEEASSNKTEVQGYFSRTPQSVLSPAAELSSEARNSSSQ